jgi:glycosyltransferase involved in cell wall biosynthesis
MRVLINGLPLFAKRLADELQKYDPQSSYIFLDTYNSKWAQLLFFIYLPFSDCVISMNGVTDNSGSLNLVLKWKKKLILQWMGTDILLAIERFKNSNIDRKYIDYATNFVDSEWLFEEVKSINVPVEHVCFKSVTIQPLIEKYEQISVVSYVAESRQEFYGMYKISEIAKIFPSIDFHLYGLKNTEFRTTSNVHFHGWVTPEVFAESLKSTPIFLRLTDHDGFSVSVIEALAYGCEVIMSLPFDITHLATTTEEAIDIIKMLSTKIEARGMTPNHTLIEAVKVRFNPEIIARNYIQKIKEIVSK